MRDDPKQLANFVHENNGRVVITVKTAEEVPKQDWEEFAKVMGDLDGRQRTILIACWLRLLLEQGEYESPLFYSYGGKEIEALIQALTTVNLTGFAKIEAETEDLDLLSAERQQDQEVASAKGCAERFRNHPASWFADITLNRYEAGGLIIKWLILIRQNNWESAEVPADLRQWLFYKKKRWIPRPDDLRSACLI
jgi:hypothetical protein